MHDRSSGRCIGGRAWNVDPHPIDARGATLNAASTTARADLGEACACR
jgi:hypothetical protein